MNLKCNLGDVKKDFFLVNCKKNPVKCCDFGEVVLRHICTVHKDCWNGFLNRGSFIMAESHDI